MKKIIGILLIMLLCGCEEKELIDNKRQIYTERVMLNKHTVSDISDEIIETPFEEVIATPEATPIETITPTPRIDHNKDIHKGRINCTLASECIDIASKNKEDFDELIKDITYVEVPDKGFFIKYVFSNYKYQTKESCENKLKEVKERFSTIIKDINCTDNELKISVDYQGGSV